MAKKIFITGTGTDVGKTYISALIVKKLRETGFNCGYYKPVMSGVVELAGKLIDSDVNYKVVKTGVGHGASLEEPVMDSHFSGPCLPKSFSVRWKVFTSCCTSLSKYDISH